MRVGKKAKVVEAKRTRSCVVRIEKVPSSPQIKATKSGVSNMPTGSTTSKSRGMLQEDKKFKGPLKKRPISHTTSTSPSQTVTPKAKDKEKHKETTAKKSVTAMDVSTPTIAAGRSRRAIKPNPKYASEDMVTPKMIKNATLGSTSTSKKGSNVSSERRRLISTSSDDFFNKESSDEVGFEDFDDTDDKVYKINEKESESDFSDAEPNPRQIKKRVIRQQKSESGTISQQLSRSQLHTSSTGIANKFSTSPSIIKSGLQFQRKSLGSNQSSGRIINAPSAVKKRKLDSIHEQIEVARKRFLMSSENAKASLEKGKSAVKLHQLNQTSPTITTPKNLPNQTLNGSKIVQVEATNSSQSNSEKRRHMPDKVLPKINLKSTHIRMPTSTTVSGKSMASKLQTFSKMRNISPKAVAKQQQQSEKKPVSPKTDTDDAETMPTFTIVNINDIINKKGDVLISKTGAKNVVKSLKPQPADNSNIATGGRRKATHTTILSEKDDPDRTKSVLPRTSHPGKKPAQTILNHTLLNKSLSNPRSTALSGKISTSAMSKPAPRILNSMVAKKTQPVKPMIANPDDSADESFQLSLDDDEELEEEDDDDDDVDNLVEPKTLSKPFNAIKKTIPATKENSLAATNRLPLKGGQRKVTPEKVVISRQGDKIIKKITCFETWFVINAPVEKQIKVERNLLDMQLIDLANVSKEIKLPSDSWSAKVTLYETPNVDKNSKLFTGDLKEQNISEIDRAKYQPSCVMFRRKASSDRLKSRLPYDRAVIFKNKTFFTNIDGKNVRLMAAPTIISSQDEVEVLLDIIDCLTLQNTLVELSSTAQ